MSFGSLNLIDILIVVGYLAAVVVIGQRASRAVRGEEGFFLAGRKLGKLYQFFLSFGNATEPQGAVSTASFVYTQGASGAWLSFQTVFMNPYFWFMNVWYRRVRLVTVSDLFEDRFGSKGLSFFYALFQIIVACVFLGFGNVTAYKIASSLVVKPEPTWTAVERTSVLEYHELRELEREVQVGPLAPAARLRLDTLRDRRARGELHSFVTLLDEVTFYVVFSLVVGTYIVLGGMSAAAVNEALQGILIVVFSLLLIPTGLAAIGGWGALREKIPPERFDLFGAAGSSQFSVWTLAAILFVSLVQIHGLSHNMGISGSARNEFAARFGVTGNYLKRFMIILWAFAGLIAIALFGVGGLADPDTAWGALSNRLLGPGLIGLMLAGVLAGTMSTLAAKALAISSLFVRNVYRQLLPHVSEQQGVRYARLTIVAVLALGVLTALSMGDFFAIVNLVLTVNLPFGAAVFLIFTWRRLTAPAVWCSVVLSTLVIIVVPNWIAPHLDVFRDRPALTITRPAPDGKPAAVYWPAVVRARLEDPASPLRGTGRFNLECWALAHAGLDVALLTPNQRFTAQFFFDGFFPFLVLFLVSYLTPPTAAARVDQFYGRMKTPVGATPELEAAALAETCHHPQRFDHTKLLPWSSWEFCKWDRVDTLGFLACSALSGAIILLFIGLLKLAG